MKKLFTFTMGLSVLLSSMSAFATFSDTGGTPSSEAATFLQKEGIVQGFSDGNYHPDQKITRAEFLKITLKSANLLDENCLEAKSFPDVSKEDWFYSVVCSAVKQNIIDGYPDGTFRPNGLINFVEASKIVAGIEKLDLPENAGTEWFSKYTAALANEKVVPATVSDNNQQVTRGEMAQIIWGIKTGTELKTKDSEKISTLDSCSELNKQLEKYQRRNQYYGGALLRNSNGMEGAVDDAENAPSAPTVERSQGAGGGAMVDYSTTNLQELGVDEADIIKNDGTHIFTIRGNTIRIIQATPPSNMKEIARITVDEKVFTPQELYLDGNTLTAIGYSQQIMVEGDASTSKGTPIRYPDGTVSTVPEMQVLDSGNEDSESVPPAAADMPVSSDTTSSDVSSERIGIFPNYGKSFVKVVSFDITDRAHPKEIRSVSLEGSYMDTRKINDVVYVVVNKNMWWGPIMPLLEKNNFDPASSSNTIGDSTLPAFSDTAYPEEKQVAPCGDIKYFPNFAEPNFMTVAAINTKDTSAKVGRTVLLGSGGTVYASTDNLYITRPDYRDVYIKNGVDIRWNPAEMTEIYKFGLEGNAVPFKASGEVEGNVWNQFAMSEYQDNFRIATQKGANWGNQQTTSSVYILGSDLKPKGKIENIAPGESIRAVRFAGNRGYLVTFKNVDPFFVIDMNPAAPQILGKLKIPGWSDYLEPYDATHLIGLGMDIKSGADGKDNITQADMLGMKLSLFDVSDINNPKEVQKTVIGARGTYSEASYNHKALLFDKTKGILALPVTVTKEQAPAQCTTYKIDDCPINLCERNYDEQKCLQPSWGTPTKVVFSGAQVYDVSLENGFKLRGQATNFDAKWFQNTQEWFNGDSERMIQRMIYIGNYFYAIAPNMIQALNWNDVSTVKTIELDPLEQKQCSEIWNEFDCEAHPSCQPVWQNSGECRLDENGKKVCDNGQQYFSRCEKK